MENKPAQNIQDTFLNTVRKDKTPITIYLVSGVKLTGKIRSFDKYSVLLENNSQEQLIFKHAISTVVSNRSVMHSEHRPAAATQDWVRRWCAPQPDPAKQGTVRTAVEKGREHRASSGQLLADPGTRRSHHRSLGSEPRAGLAGFQAERAVLVGVDLQPRATGVRPGSHELVRSRRRLRVAAALRP